MLASISGDGKSIVLALNPRVNTDVQLVKYATLSDYRPERETARAVSTSTSRSIAPRNSPPASPSSPAKPWSWAGCWSGRRSTLVESVPVLGDIPLLGVLFRRRTEVDTPRYLLIFVTATIVKDTGEFLVYEDEPFLQPTPPRPTQRQR